MTRKIRTQRNKTKQPKNPEWLIMVYINVDGWKANFAIESLKQLRGAANAKVVVAAQLGIEGANDYRRYVFNGAKSNGAKKEATSLELDRKPWHHAANPNMAKALKVELKPLSQSTADIKKSITDGVGKMKPVSSVTGADLDNVVAYVQSLKK